MKIGVSIFTKNLDVWRLKSCLGCLIYQSRPPDEILVLDFGSDDSYRLQYKSLFPEVKNIKFIDIDNDTDIFHPARLSNVGLRETSADYIIFMDGDCLCEYHTFYIVEKVFSKPNRFVMCSRLDLKEDSNHDQSFVGQFEYWWRANGSVANHPASGSFQGFNVEWLKGVGGYNESYVGWGFYDEDIRDRAIRDGLHLIWLDTLGVQLMHIYHKQRDYEFKTDFDKNRKIYGECKGVKI